MLDVSNKVLGVDIQFIFDHFLFQNMIVFGLYMLNFALYSFMKQFKLIFTYFLNSRIDFQIIPIK